MTDRTQTTDPLPSIYEWLRGLAADTTCDKEHFSANTLRRCLRDERDQARRFITRHGAELRKLS